MWVYRLGAEKARRMLFTGDKVTGRVALHFLLVLAVHRPPAEPA